MNWRGKQDFFLKKKKTRGDNITLAKIKSYHQFSMQNKERKI